MHSSLFIYIASVFTFVLVIINPVTAQQQKILIMGDSLSAGYHMKIQSSWPFLLQKTFDKTDKNIRIINASISGETTFGGKNRIHQLIQQHQPTFIIIQLGGNDGLRGLNIKISQANLVTMIATAKNYGSPALLIGVRLPPNLGKRYNERFQSMYRTVAQQEDVFYLEKFLLDIAGNQQLMQNDGIHPLPIAQPLLKEKVLKALLKTGLF